MRCETEIKRGVLVLLLTFLAVFPASAEQWTFVAVGDNRSAFPSYRNVLEEIRDLKAGRPSVFPPVELILGCGDLSPVDRNDEILKEVFRKTEQPSFLPVRGNHETPSDVDYCFARLLPALGKNLRTQAGNCLNFYLDRKNVRFIALDRYCDAYKRSGGKTTLRWLEESLASASMVDHVFVVLHAPVFPGDLGDDGLWDTLFQHRDKVRAVFAGHTHSYDRARFPEQNGSIWYINVGNAGWISHGDNRQTIVEVMVDGPGATFRIVQAPNGTPEFKVRDQWETDSRKPRGGGLP